MDDRENSLALIKKGTPERIGYYDTFWPELVREWHAQGHMVTSDPDNGETVYIDPGEYFGVDFVGVMGWFDTLPDRGVHEVIEENDEWKITRDGAGASFKSWKKKSGTPEHIDFLMNSREVWERDYRGKLLELDDRRLLLDSVRELWEKHCGGAKVTTWGHTFIWECLRQSVGDMVMFESIALDPEWVHDFNRVYTDFYKIHTLRLFDLFGIPDAALVFDDLGYRNGLFCSPSALEELYFPYYKEFNDFFHTHGVACMLHACGGIEKALPLIVGAGFDVLNPMEVKAGCDVVHFAEMYGDRLAFLGGMDTRIFESGDRGLIKREILRLAGGMKSLGARWFFGSDHSITPKTKFDDYCYAVDVYRDNMYY